MQSFPFSLLSCNGNSILVLEGNPGNVFPGPISISISSTEMNLLLSRIFPAKIPKIHQVALLGPEEFLDAPDGIQESPQKELPDLPAERVRELRFWNRDGTFAKNCVNGTRCAAWWILRERETQSTFLRVGAQKIQCDLERSWFQSWLCTTHPLPDYLGQGAYQTDFPEPDPGLSDHHSRLHWVSCGNLHAIRVVSCDLRQAKAFPLPKNNLLRTRDGQPFNLSLIFPESGRNLWVRTFEHGAGETGCCGSASLAVWRLVREDPGRFNRHIRPKRPVPIGDSPEIPEMEMKISLRSSGGILVCAGDQNHCTTSGPVTELQSGNF